jgi:hypothetical protein
MTERRDLGGCPMLHLDVSQATDAGAYWQRADELRETSPTFFNDVAQGYWVFTRHAQCRAFSATR